MTITKRYRPLLFCLAFLTSHVRSEVAIDQLIEDAGLREGPVAARDFAGWREPGKIVVRGAPELLGELREQYPSITFIGANTTAEAVAEMPGADAVIGMCNDDIVAAADRLVWVQIGSAGAERCLGVDAVADGRILLTNMQKMSSPVIGEHAVAMMMALMRGLTVYGKAMETGAWDRSLAEPSGMTPIAGKTVLIVGLGGIGIAAARRAAGLGMRVIATRNSSRTGPDFVDYVGLSDELAHLAAEADVIINALPLTPETTGLFDKDFFDQAKRGVFFVNVARGGSVVTDDLVAALEDGRVAAAGLDVTDPEPLPPDHPLWQMNNVIITPHIAWYGETGERHRALVKENIRRFVRGDALLNVVDPERGY